jgi:hypothetical protein
MSTTELSREEIVEQKVIEITDKMLIKFPNLKQHPKDQVIRLLTNVGGCWPPNFDEQYFMDVENMCSILAETKVYVTYVKTDRYFPEDKDIRDIYRIKVERKDKGTATFRYGASMVDTWAHKRPELYEIFSSIASDYSYGQANTFEDFSEEFGYMFDHNEREIKKQYTKAKRQFLKLEKLFDESEIYSFPG